jgi:hypothetical protein
MFFIVLSLCLFGYLLKSIGLVLSLALLVVVSAFAGHEFKIKEVLILSVAMIIFSGLVFSSMGYLSISGLTFQSRKP